MEIDIIKINILKEIKEQNKMAAMNKISEKLFLGNVKAASDIRQLKNNGISHILQVAAGIQPFFPNDFKYKVLNV